MWPARRSFSWFSSADPTWCHGTSIDGTRTSAGFLLRFAATNHSEIALHAFLMRHLRGLVRQNIVEGGPQYAAGPPVGLSFTDSRSACRACRLPTAAPFVGLSLAESRSPP